MAERQRTALVAHPGAELYGSDRVMLETVAALVERQWRVVVVLPGTGPLVAELERLGAEVRQVPAPVLRKSMLRPRAVPGLIGGSLSAARRIRRVLRELAPDVVYVSTVTLPLWTLLARAARIHVVVHVHEGERDASPLVREALATPLRVADRIVVNSGFSRDCLIEAVPALADRSVIVYNGVAGPGSVRPPRTDLQGGLRIAYVGRLSPRKGVDVAIDALALLVASGIDASLDLIGGVFPGYEWYEEQLHARARRLGVQDRVTFHGFQPAVWGALADSDVAVVPSRLDEPFGNTAVEAVLAGRPVVVSAIGGLAEAIDGFASAIPVGPDDPRELAEALARIGGDWQHFRVTARDLVPEAAERYAPGRYRREIAAEMDGVLAGSAPFAASVTG